MEPWLLRQRKLCPLTSDPLFEPSSSEKCGPSPEAGRRGQWTGCPALHIPETGSPGAPGHRSRGGCRPQAQAGAHEGRATAGVWIRAGPPWAGHAGESGSLVPQQERAGSPEHCRSHPAPSASSLQNMRDSTSKPSGRFSSQNYGGTLNKNQFLGSILINYWCGVGSLEPKLLKQLQPLQYTNTYIWNLERC